MKILLVMALLASWIVARENPFLAPSEMEKAGVVTSKTSQIENLDKVSVTLPDTSRVIKKFVIEYQNSDGTISQRVVEMNIGVDWHKPITISQEGGSKGESETNMTAPEDGHAITHKSSKTQHQTKSTPKARVSGGDKINSLVSYTLSNGGIIIYSKDMFMRDFALTDPFKVVVDFRYDGFKSSVEKEVSGSIVKHISFGSHKDFYRVAIELDGRYTYKLEPVEGGVKINFN